MGFRGCRAAFTRKICSINWLKAQYDSRENNGGQEGKCEWCQPWEEQGVELTHHTYNSCPLFKRNMDKKRHLQRRRVKMGEKSVGCEDPLKERRFILSRRQLLETRVETDWQVWRELFSQPFRAVIWKNI